MAYTYADYNSGVCSWDGLRAKLLKSDFGFENDMRIFLYQLESGEYVIDICNAVFHEWDGDDEDNFTTSYESIAEYQTDTPFEDYQKEQELYC